MPIQTPKSGTQYASEILTILQSTGIKNISPGGKARALADIIADRMGDLEARSFITASQNLLPFATTDALDAIGDIYGVQRIAAQDATSPSSDGNFIFFVTSGTFGDVNSGQDILIPAGTRIFTAASNGPVYTVDIPTTLPATSASISVNASALDAGSLGNAPANVFNRHSFANYAQSTFGTLLVTNNFGIIGGRDAEDDESYRFRINLKLQSVGGAGEVDLRAAILQIPGIQDVVFSSLAGTYLVYVYGISPAVPPSLLSLVQTSINARTAYPLTGTAVVPDLVGVSLSTTLQLKSGLSTVDQSSVISNAQQAAANYINNLTIGQELVINEIAALVLGSDTRILDIGDPNEPLLEIFIWRSRTDGTRYSRFLINDYPPATGERIVVENIPNAINLTVAV
jgi:phage-related baseplate assembly protein